MAEKLLTDRKCSATKTTTGEILLGDGGNLYLRVRPNAKDWLFIYRWETRQPKLSLGKYPDISLAEARDKALEARKLLAQGIDPKQHRLETEITRRAEKAVQSALPQNVQQLFDEWFKRDLSKRRADAGASVDRAFQKDVLPTLGEIPLSLIRRAHVTQLLDQVSERGVTRTVGILLADLRQMFSFGLARELLPLDPTFGLKKAAWQGIAAERDRVLSQAEIKALSKTLPNSDLLITHQHAIWIMLSTLARVGEISKARRSDIDLNAKTWLIPAEHSKNGIEHLIDLSPFALLHIKALLALEDAAAKKAEREQSLYLLPARHHQGHLDVKTLAKQVGDRQRKAAPMAKRSPHTSSLVLPGGKWTPHDLRRTGATLMGELGVRPEVIEKCLNHVEANRMKRVYQRQELRPDMKKAWHALGHVLAKCSVGNS